ncbi:hypothetical protein GCM10023345_01680 [Acinetobacter kookii]
MQIVQMHHISPQRFTWNIYIRTGEIISSRAKNNKTINHHHNHIQYYAKSYKNQIDLFDNNNA